MSFSEDNINTYVKKNMCILEIKMLNRGAEYPPSSPLSFVLSEIRLIDYRYFYMAKRTTCDESRVKFLSIFEKAINKNHIKSFITRKTPECFENVIASRF